ncbi:hypothetical protein GCM10012286_82160 [Streptomyces lasiicapitis]|uniref:Uncharacterized protein n=1 Tax=Streptomyces lasiicapitis TaxID=1923961 RepID=A0ABQ2MVW1_9ACTN|nr:hypothetical protein GCM10012286_82160 [Streptomyces lasiicapitis]
MQKMGMGVGVWAGDSEGGGLPRGEAGTWGGAGGGQAGACSFWRVGSLTSCRNVATCR